MAPSQPSVYLFNGVANGTVHFVIWWRLLTPCLISPIPVIEAQHFCEFFPSYYFLSCFQHYQVLYSVIFIYLCNFADYGENVAIDAGQMTGGQMENFDVE
jgi:hypothetical protein